MEMKGTDENALSTLLRRAVEGDETALEVSRQIIGEGADAKPVWQKGSKMNTLRVVNQPVAIERISAHQDVSRFSAPGFLDSPKGEYLRPYAEGLKLLTKLRRTLGNWKRARVNAAEEGAAARAYERRGGPGAAYDAGYSMGVPSKPTAEYQIRRVREAVAAGLPPTLDALARTWLAQQGA